MFVWLFSFVFFKQKTAYEMRISDWSSDVCSSDLLDQRRAQVLVESLIVEVSTDKAAEFGIQWMAGGNDLSSGNTSFMGGANFNGSGINPSEIGRASCRERVCQYV